MQPKRNFFFMALWLICLFSINLPQIQAAEPAVSNVKASQRLDGLKIVDIYYDVEDADSASVTVSVKISDDDGITFAIAPVTLSGDVGQVAPGKSKHIVWDCGKDLPGRSGNLYSAYIGFDEKTLVIKVMEGIEIITFDIPDV